MKCLAIVLAILLTGAWSAMPASASESNGELCSVESLDQAIRTSVYVFPPRPTRFATRQQVAHAAAWCSNQVAVTGWSGANKFYDDYMGQVTVCFIHFPGDDVAFFQYANTATADLSVAEEGCREIAGANSDVIAWYP